MQKLLRTFVVFKIWNCPLNQYISRIRNLFYHQIFFGFTFLIKSSIATFGHQYINQMDFKRYLVDSKSKTSQRMEIGPAVDI